MFDLHGAGVGKNEDALDRAEDCFPVGRGKQAGGTVPLTPDEKKEKRATKITGEKHTWIYRGVCQKKTSQLGPNPHGMETLDRIQHQERRQDAQNRLVLEPQDIGFDLNKQSGKSSIMERGTSRVQRQQGGNTQDI